MVSTSCTRAQVSRAPFRDPMSRSKHNMRQCLWLTTTIRSVRWSSGYNSGLLITPECYCIVLVRELESSRGEILNIFSKIKKGATAESA